ncbi:MAG: PEP-CTERM sorting domain-containing protein [Planctomycetia bacterium]
MLHAAAAAAATITTVPLSGFYNESWQPATLSLNGGPPPVLTVSQTAAGWGWNTSYYIDTTSNNPAVLAALTDGAANPGSTIRFSGRFSQSLLTPGAEAITFLGLNIFNQGSLGSSGSEFVQSYNLAGLGSTSFPIGGGTADVPFTFEMPIVAYTGTATPDNGTGNFYVNPVTTFMKFGIGTNSDGGGTVGYFVDEVSVSVVPEPGSLPLLAVGGAAICCMVRRRLRSMSGEGLRG